jgi:Domain of unknown function (DUF5666)
MKHSITSHSRWRFISQISEVAVCIVVFLSLLSCGSGGSGSSASPFTASTGSNVVTGTMPMTAVASREPASDTRSFFAQLWNFLTTEPLAYAMSKGSVQVVGTNIKALPVGGGRFELIGVPDGPVTIQFTTPDGVTGTLTLNVPQGGGALVDLGTVIVKHDGRVEFRPSSTNVRFPNVVKARGKVSGLAALASAVPTDGTCPTFVVAGLTFCFDQHTRFDPPLTVANPLINTESSNLIVDVIGEPTADATTHVFHARRIQRNHGAPAAVNEKIKVRAPITNVGEDTLTLFGGTSDTPDAHAIMFNTASAKFEPGALKQNVVKGLLVEVIAGPVSTDDQGNQSSNASTVKLVRLHDTRCSKGESLDVEGTISSLQPQSKTFGLNSDKLFVHVLDNLTRFDDPLTSFDSLTVGLLVVVTALPPQTTGGPLQALEVDLKEASGNAPIEVRGAILSLDTTNKTFIVGGITFCYNCNSVTPLFDGLTTLANGQFVEVHGTALSNGVSTALEVAREDDPRPNSCSDHEGRDDDNEHNQTDDNQQR